MPYGLPQSRQLVELTYDLCAFDDEALAYIQRVEAADGAALELNVKIAINNFVQGCKSDGIWRAIKASCILAGARTLKGALVPLVGADPSNVNFVNSDYNRKTGLIGDGITKYINVSRNSNVDPQNSFHMGCYLSSNDINLNQVLMGNQGGATTGSNCLLCNAGNLFSRNRTTTAVSHGATNPLKFLGTNRATSTTYTLRRNSTTTSHTVTSETPRNQDMAVFAGPGGDSESTSRIAFYTFGESLDLDKLDTRVTTLVSALSAAIP